MATALETQIAELTKQGASLAEAVGSIKKTLETPQFPGVHAGEGALSYWEIEGERQQAAQAINMMPGGRYKSFNRRMPKGYKNDVWKTAGDFYRDLAKNGNRPEFATKHAGIFKSIQGMSESVASEGGYMTVPEYNQTIFEKVYDNDLFAGLDQYTVSGNSMRFLRNAEVSRVNGSRHGGLQGYWTDEGASVSSTKPTIKAIQCVLKKLAIVVYLTQELIDDGGAALEQYVSKKAADEFNFMLGDAVFNGTGVGMPLGLLTSGALLSIAKETGQAAATIVTENIDKMWARRFAGGMYKWYTNQDTHPQLSSLSRGVGAAGELVYNPPGGISAAPYGTLKGSPIQETEFNATLGTQGDVILADTSKIVAITKGGINQAVSTHVEFLTDQTALRFTMRVDFRPWEDSPVTPYKGTNSQSSFVTLDTRG